MIKASTMTDLKKHASNCYKRMDVINSIISGSSPQRDLRRFACRHYAEIKTFIDIKLPQRLRICTHDAVVAKKFFWELYGEEQGNFEPNKNHAAIFKPFCHKLGLTDGDLDAEFSSYWPKYRYMFDLQPSHDVMVRELAISYAWETITLEVGPALMESLEINYGFAKDDLYYFSLHFDADQGHSEHALSVLAEHIVDENSKSIALDSITETLITDNYLLA